MTGFGITYIDDQAPQTVFKWHGSHLIVIQYPLELLLGG